MKNKRILLTGSSGFIGKNIFEQLSNKHAFISPTHKQLDLTSYYSVEKFFKTNKFFDVVIHCANFGGNRKVPNTFDIALADSKMFFNLANMNKYFGKMIHIGSGAEFGKDKPIIKAQESDFGNREPIDPFGLYKFICAKYVEKSSKILNLRLFGIFGKYEDYEIRFISNAICKSILKMPITINQNVFFDYLYVDDFIKILDYFITHTVKYKTYNVGSGIRTDLLTIAKKINKFSNEKTKIKIRHTGLGNEYTCNNNRLLREIRNFKFTNFEQSLQELYMWYLGRKSSLKKKSFLDDHFKNEKQQNDVNSNIPVY